MSAASFDSADPRITTNILGHIVSTLSLLWLCIIGLICYFKDQILGIFWLSQNHIGRFSWINFFCICLLDTLVLKRFVFYCLVIFGGPIYCCLANRLRLIVLFARQNPSLSLNLVWFSYYLL